MNNDPKPLIIDCDPGVDDAAALFLALSHKNVDIHAITTIFGNVGLQQTTINALKILEVAGRKDIPVFRGVEKTFDHRSPIDSKNVHGDDGLGNNFFSEPNTDQLMDQHAVFATIDLVNKYEYICLPSFPIKVEALFAQSHISRLSVETNYFTSQVHHPPLLHSSTPLLPPPLP